MAATCTCKDCTRETVSKMRVRLDEAQQLMLGFFCYICILNRCGATHDNRRARTK